MTKRVFPDRRPVGRVYALVPLGQAIRAAFNSNILVRAAWATIIAALIALADPMGLDKAADKHSADVIGRVGALFYGGEPDSVRDRIAVVEVTDQTLNQLVREEVISRPPSRSFYAQILGSLAAQPGPDRPAVVFFDYAFVSTADENDAANLLNAIKYVTRYDGESVKPDGGDPKASALAAEKPGWGQRPECHVSPLAKMRCIAKAGGIPVIIGKNYPPNACITGEHNGDNRQAMQLAEVAVLVPLGWPDLPSKFHPVQTHSDYVDALVDAKYADTDNCRDIYVPPRREGAPAPTADLPWAPLGIWPRPDDGYDLSPALAMAFAVCLRDEQRSLAQGSPACAAFPPSSRKVAPWSQTPVTPDLPAAFLIADPVGPIWGSRPDPNTDKVQKQLYPQATANPDCKKEDLNPVRVVEVAWSQMTSGLGEGAAAVAVPCPYHLTIDVDAFTNLDHDLKDVRVLLKDRAIAIGAAQALSNDWIATTLNARQAGVHYHAMTLDNLLTYGKDLPREPPPLFPGTVFEAFDWGDLLELACLFLIALIVEFARRRMSADEDRGVWSVDLPKETTWWGARVREAEAYWATARGQRRRMRLVAGVLGVAVLVLLVATLITVVKHWAPVNLLGLAGFTVIWVAYELWSHEGWGGMFGFIISAVLLAPVWIGRRAGLLKASAT